MKNMTKRSFSTKLITLCAGLGIFSCVAPVQAAFHLWTVTEIYSDASGSLQFIELVDNFGSQQFVGGQPFQISNTGNTITHTYNFGSSLPSESFNHRMLLGTAGIQAAGGPAPDFIIPNNFIFMAGGNVNFYNANGPYPALPSDGNLSYTWGGGTAANSPQNFAGQIGHVAVPEPASGLFLLAAGAGFAFLRRK